LSPKGEEITAGKMGFRRLAGLLSRIDFEMADTCCVSGTQGTGEQRWRGQGACSFETVVIFNSMKNSWMRRFSSCDPEKSSLESKITVALRHLFRIFVFLCPFILC